MYNANLIAVSPMPPEHPKTIRRLRWESCMKFKTFKTPKRINSELKSPKLKLNSFCPNARFNPFKKPKRIHYISWQKGIELVAACSRTTLDYYQFSALDFPYCRITSW